MKRSELPVRPRPAAQRGVVLIGSLILLIIVTLVGYSVMETSNLETRKATASELKAISFQTAEGILEVAISDLNYLGQALNASLAGSAWPTRNNYAYSGYDQGTRSLSVNGSSEMRYLTNASTVGYSIRKGSSGIDTYYYEAESTSTMANTNISNNHVQGIYVEGPRVN